MKIVLFGATGMVGQGVLHECLRDPGVESVVSVVRRPSKQTHAKLTEVVHPDFFDFTSVEPMFEGVGACFFCLGVSSVGMNEAQYARLTYDLTMAAARSLHKKSPGLVFCYVSGMGTDSTEKGKSMWARVKGRTENAIAAMGFGAAYGFRPGYIQPMHGVKSSARATRLMYALAAPLYPVWKALIPKFVTTTEAIGRAMLRVAREKPDLRYLEPPEINRFGA